MAKSELPTPNLISQLLAYDPATGHATWRERPLEFFKDARAHRVWNSRYSGVRAGSVATIGYIYCYFMGRNFPMHRLIWAAHTGAWPVGQIDHINGNRADNRWVNLREVSKAQNQRNMKRRVDNKTGQPGIHITRSGSFGVTIGKKFVGTFPTFDLALKARKAAEIEKDYHPNHGRAKSND